MKRILPKHYTESEMIALACLPDINTRHGLRDRAILGVLMATGLRASELCALHVADVTPEVVFVRQGKFGHQRFVPLSARAWRAIVLYLAHEPAGVDEPLFRTLDGRPLSRRLLHKIVTGHSRRLGLTGGVHTCRHAFATRALNRGVGLQSLRVMLGHVRITTTAVYLGTATRSLITEYRRCLDPAALTP